MEEPTVENVSSVSLTEESIVQQAIEEDEHFRESKGYFEFYHNLRTIYCQKTLLLIGAMYFNIGGDAMQNACTIGLLR